MLSWGGGGGGGGGVLMRLQEKMATSQKQYITVCNKRFMAGLFITLGSTSGNIDICRK